MQFHFEVTWHQVFRDIAIAAGVLIAIFATACLENGKWWDEEPPCPITGCI